MKSSKGIILAGGKGTRLYPITKSMSKQLIPVYDKPMIYYPLTTLMLSDIRDILIIVNPSDINNFENLLGNGDKFGVNIRYSVQEKPEGLAQAFVIGEKFIDGDSCCLILGDNIFYGDGMPHQMQKARKSNGATLFAYSVKDPERYGVVHFDDRDNVIDIQEKPISPKSNFAVTGVYFYDETVVEKAKSLKLSPRNEYEITDLNMLYFKEKNLNVLKLSRGSAWLDTGTFESLNDANNFIKTIESRQNMKIGCPEEVAWRKGWINNSQLEKLASVMLKSNYGQYLLGLLN